MCPTHKFASELKQLNLKKKKIKSWPALNLLSNSSYAFICSLNISGFFTFKDYLNLSGWFDLKIKMAQWYMLIISAHSQTDNGIKPPNQKSESTFRPFSFYYYPTPVLNYCYIDSASLTIILSIFTTSLMLLA